MTELIATFKKSSLLLSAFFNKGTERTIRIKKNVAGSILMRGLGMLIGFIQVPITLKYLGSTAYGIWITIGSFIVLFSFFDIGLSNGLRNKLAESIAKNDRRLGQAYTSLTYLLVSGIVTILYLTFLIIYPHVDWLAILNAPESYRNAINVLVLIVYTSFSVGFILQIIRTIPIADQKPAYVDLIKLMASAFTLIGIVTLTYVSEGSLIYVGIVFGLVPIIVYAGFTIYLFSNTYKNYKPSIRLIDFKYTKDLTNLGIKFFVIQISALVLYSTDNIIIAQVLGPSEVAPYSIAFRYFSSMMLIFILITTPYWSSFTDAYHKDDFPWIKKSILSLKNIAIALSAIVIVMILLAEYVYKFWVGSMVTIPFSLSFFMGLNVIIMMFTMPYVNFINGVGVITLQLIVGVIEALINIPLSIYLAKNMQFGITGVMMATCAANSIAFILWPIQYRKIINKNAKGIWAK